MFATSAPAFPANICRAVRTLLPRGQGALARVRRDWPGLGDRQACGAGALGHNSRRKRAEPRLHFLLHFAPAERACDSIEASILLRPAASLTSLLICANVAIQRILPVNLTELHPDFTENSQAQAIVRFNSLPARPLCWLTSAGSPKRGTTSNKLREQNEFSRNGNPQPRRNLRAIAGTDVAGLPRGENCSRNCCRRNCDRSVLRSRRCAGARERARHPRPRHRSRSDFGHHAS